YRTETFVGACQEFFSFVGLFSGYAIDAVIDAVSFDQVGRRFRCKGVSGVILTEQTAPVNDRPAGCCEMDQPQTVVERARTVSPVYARRGADGIDPVIGHDAFVVPGQVFLGRIGGAKAGREVISQQIGGIVIVNKPALVVLGNAPLTPEQGAFNQPTVALFAVAFGRLGIVDPVVQRPVQAVGLVLHVASHGVFGIYECLFSRNAVVVVDKPKVWRLGDRNPVFDQADGAGQHQGIHENGSPVHFAVPIGVFQDGDPARGGVFACSDGIGHVAGHFHNPHPAGLIKGHGNRRGDQGLGGDQFNGETVFKLKVLKRFLGAQYG